MIAARATDPAPTAPASATRRRLPLGPRYEACGGEAQQRPCPRAACRYYLEDPAPSLFGEDEGRPTCALDVAGEGGVELGTIGALFGVTGEAIRQTVLATFPRLRKRCDELGISPTDFMHSLGMAYPERFEEEPRGGGRKRREPVEVQEPLFGGMKK